MHFIFKLQTELHFTSIILTVFKKIITQKQNSTGNRRNLMQDWCFCMQFDVMHSNHLEIKKFKNIKYRILMLVMTAPLCPISLLKPTWFPQGCSAVCGWSPLYCPSLVVTTQPVFVVSHTAEIKITQWQLKNNNLLCYKLPVRNF